MADEPELCGEQHPDHPEVTCDKKVPCYRFHASRQMGGLDWGEQPEPPSKTSTPRGRAGLAQMASRAQSSQRAGGPTLDIRGTHGVGGPPVDWRQEYEGQIKEPWVEDATRTFHEFLRTRTESFTTPQDLWPLLDAPEEMREMVRVVRRALQEGWIEEVAAKRLNGVYRTRDGVEFKMNKLVPVYESRICDG